MRFIAPLVILCLFDLATLPAPCRERQRTSSQRGAELLNQAERFTDIRTGDIPSFRLTARVEAYDEKGKKQEGTYTLLWNSPTIWREEIMFPDYSQTRLARINKLLISRNHSVPSEHVYWVVMLMDLGQLMRLGSKDQIQQVDEKAQGGMVERRVDIEIAKRRVDVTIAKVRWKKVYFDGASPLPTLIEYEGATLGTQHLYKNFDWKFQLDDYMEFHGLQFPRTLRRIDSNVLKDQVQIQEWVDATYGESDFNPPDNSQWIHWCPRPEPPIFESGSMMSDLPAQLRKGGPSSRVVIYGIIGVDGMWHYLQGVKPEGNMVDSLFWMDQMRRQRFSPAKCGETPVESEMMIEFEQP